MLIAFALALGGLYLALSGFVHLMDYFETLSGAEQRRIGLWLPAVSMVLASWGAWRAYKARVKRACDAPGR